MPRRKVIHKVQLTAAEITGALWARSLVASGKVEGMCKHAAPCGGICVLNPDVIHIYHGCNDKNCAACHGYNRFGRSYK